jgi:hypothetical protein
MPLPSVLVTTAIGASVNALAKRHGVRVVGMAASAEDAARRVQAGEADGILDVTPEGWASLVLPAGGHATEAERQQLAPALAAAGTTAITAASGVAGFAAASVLLRSAIKQTMAERRQRGQRVGPRPVKPSRRLTELVIDRQRDGDSLRAIADALNAAGEPTLKGTGQWHPASVKRLIDGSRTETRVVLRRLAGVLTDLERQQPVDTDHLEQLGREHGFHHHRLWLAFERGYGKPYESGLIPPVHKGPDGFTVSDQGDELLRIWERSEQLDDAIEALCMDLDDAGGATDPQAFGTLCAKHARDASDIPQELVTYNPASGRFELTDDGTDVARIWRRLASSDPRERLDIDFWPEAHEEAQLRPDWDWDDDPFAA